MRKHRFLIICLLSTDLSRAESPFPPTPNPPNLLSATVNLVLKSMEYPRGLLIRLLACHNNDQSIEGLCLCMNVGWLHYANDVAR